MVLSIRLISLSLIKLWGCVKSGKSYVDKLVALKSLALSLSNISPELFMRRFCLNGQASWKLNLLYVNGKYKGLYVPSHSLVNGFVIICMKSVIDIYKLYQNI